ncbi:uncharacterized protein LOC133399281 isoform X2 [Phycodurus eques]|uniref:uncharacterized protein LOC133399281 isoform X2 n=1 Tax=Phycodurus eques TaxID=693459 RepID=UPI002ACEFC1F|nr:uncharacterized protein LOC133399281 isoform X2 [Phycodurus eques]
MCAKMVKEDYEEELRTNERQGQVPDAVFEQPQDELHGADVHEKYVLAPELSHIKYEEEEEEEEADDIAKLQLTVAPLKSEDEVKSQSEEIGGAEPPSGSSSQHTTREGYRDHCGGSQADSLFAPLSDSDDTTSPDSDGEEHSKGTKPAHWKLSSFLAVEDVLWKTNDSVEVSNVHSCF